MKDEYTGQLFSADHAQSLSFSYASDNEYCLEFWKEIGGKLVVTNSRLAEIMGIEKTDLPVAKKILCESYDKGNHLFGIDAGNHSGYWFRFTDGFKKADQWDGFKGLNFIVIDKEPFQRNYQSYCRKVVSRQVKGVGRILPKFLKQLSR